ncbi:pyruvate dehydrogenase (acetyl-transferring) E1 component subunit alpha [Nonomuraea sp. NPDC051191]|uniref:pyruvate dehydrogenase (acetyl-transferring) E1 component subunit alpha n=1 Tax=Nonomuraea sp. NPDC051191 TaxID=3364372 RepID=UPI00378BB5A7
MDDSMVQLLTPSGERVEHPEYPLLISDDEIRSLYRDLVVVRRIDSEAVALARQGELGLWTSLLGQEAAQVGSGRAVGDLDAVFPSYREHGVAYCRGMDPLDVVAMWRGVNHGGWDPARHNFFLYTIVIGTQALHATGYAMGMQRDGVIGTDKAGATIAYFGDGATSQGDVNEAFVFAGACHAPIVFFCQNNQWAISEPQERQSRIPLYRRAEGFGFPGVRVDGNDVLACLAVTRKALADARSGQGPTLVEAFTYRMGAHTTSDDPTRYRAKDDVEAWRRRDPIERVRAYLTAAGTGEDFFDEVEADAAKIGAELRRRCLELPDPVPSAMFEHVYAEPHALIESERAQHAAYLDGFAAGE